MKKVVIIVLVSVLAGALVFAQMFEYVGQTSNLKAPSSAPKSPDPASLRTTESGPVLGFSDQHDTHAWLGIPYAASPIGAFRWRAPQPVAPWSQTLAALEPSTVCSQPWTKLSGQIGSQGDIIGSEDCLYLNVWAPRSAAVNAAQIEQQLPVMLWIHGGGNAVGSAQTYPGHQLASQQQVVFVSVNYRLGYLGLFSHPALRNGARNLRDASGNYAALDIIAALTWVQKNIANFGGDSNNVTIFGSATGGRNVVAMLASPLAEGLFHKAIVQSGSMRTESRQSAENFSDDPQPGQISSSSELIAQLLIDLGAASNRDEAKEDLQLMSDAGIAAFLYRQNAADILSASRRNPYARQPIHQVPQLIRDGSVLPLEPLSEIFSHPMNYNNVPIMLGSNRDEAKTLMAAEADYVTWRFGLIPHIIEPEKYTAMASLRSERSHLFAVEQPARLMAGSRLDVEQPRNIYAYRFDWDDLSSNWFVDMADLIGAGQGLETSFLFGDFETGLAFTNLYTSHTTASRVALSNAIMDYWGHFAYTGSPGRGRSATQPEWQPWSATGVNTMIFDNPENRGWGMQARHLSVEKLTQRIIEETTINNQRERCQLFVKMFLFSEQTSDYWDSERYRTLADVGCEDYPTTLFMNAY